MRSCQYCVTPAVTEEVGGHQPLERCPLSDVVTDTALTTHTPGVTIIIMSDTQPASQAPHITQKQGV